MSSPLDSWKAGYDIRINDGVFARKLDVGSEHTGGGVFEIIIDTKKKELAGIVASGENVVTANSVPVKFVSEPFTGGRKQTEILQDGISAQLHPADVYSVTVLAREAASFYLHVGPEFKPEDEWNGMMRIEDVPEQEEEVKLDPERFMGWNDKKRFWTVDIPFRKGMETGGKSRFARKEFYASTYDGKKAVARKAAKEWRDQMEAARTDAYKKQKGKIGLDKLDTTFPGISHKAPIDGSYITKRNGGAVYIVEYKDLDGNVGELAFPYSNQEEFDKIHRGMPLVAGAGKMTFDPDSGNSLAGYDFIKPYIEGTSTL